MLMMLMGLLASNLPYEILPTFLAELHFIRGFPCVFLGDGPQRDFFYLGGGALETLQPRHWLGLGLGELFLSLLFCLQKREGGKTRLPDHEEACFEYFSEAASFS